MQCRVHLGKYQSFSGFDASFKMFATLNAGSISDMTHAMMCITHRQESSNNMGGGHFEYTQVFYPNIIDPFLIHYRIKQKFSQEENNDVFFL